MNNENSNPTGKSNKLLLFVFFGVFFVTLVLVSLYFYKSYAASKNISINSEKMVTNTGTINSINTLATPSASSIVIYDVTMAHAKVGEAYKAVVHAGIYGQNIQIIGSASGLPTGLKLASCSTEYDSTILEKISPKNSFFSCPIEGTPQVGGDFMIRFTFSLSGQPEKVFEDLPLVVNP